MARVIHDLDGDVVPARVPHGVRRRVERVAAVNRRGRDVVKVVPVIFAPRATQRPWSHRGLSSGSPDDDVVRDTLTGPQVVTRLLILERTQKRFRREAVLLPLGGLVQLT